MRQSRNKKWQTNVVLINTGKNVSPTSQKTHIKNKAAILAQEVELNNKKHQPTGTHNYLRLFLVTTSKL